MRLITENWRIAAIGGPKLALQLHIEEDHIEKEWAARRFFKSAVNGLMISTPPRTIPSRMSSGTIAVMPDCAAAACRRVKTLLRTAA